MSALGQKQTSDERQSMSGIPPKADITRHKKWPPTRTREQVRTFRCCPKSHTGERIAES